MARTISSIDATEMERALIADLEPWPTTNEAAWAIARKHLTIARIKTLEAARHIVAIVATEDKPVEMIDELIEIVRNDMDDSNPSGGGAHDEVDQTGEADLHQHGQGEPGPQED